MFLNMIMSNKQKIININGGSKNRQKNITKGLIFITLDTLQLKNCWLWMYLQLKSFVFEG